MGKMIKLNCWVYCRLLIFYPRELREKFGTEMVEIFEDLLCEAAGPQRGGVGIALVRPSGN